MTLNWLPLVALIVQVIPGFARAWANPMLASLVPTDLVDALWPINAARGGRGQDASDVSQ